MRDRTDALALRGLLSGIRVVVGHVGLDRFGCQRAPFDANHTSGQQCCDVSVSCFVAHELPPFWMSWASPKPSVLETRDTERGLSEMKASGSGKESSRLPKTGSSGPEVRPDSSCNSRSAATQRWIPRSMISAIDRKRADAGSAARSCQTSKSPKESRRVMSATIHSTCDARSPSRALVASMAV